VGHCRKMLVDRFVAIGDAVADGLVEALVSIFTRLSESSYGAA
jgi:hypothetical protein